MINSSIATDGSRNTFHLHHDSAGSSRNVCTIRALSNRQLRSKSYAARLFVCAIKRRINNAWVFSVSPYHFLLIFERFLADGFPHVLFAFIELREIVFRSKLV
jgi:hypothetical protein